MALHETKTCKGLNDCADVPSAPMYSPSCNPHAEISWIDFSSIVNPLGTPPSFIRAVEKAVDEGELNHPSTDKIHSLSCALARHYNLSEESFLVGSTVNSLLKSVVQSFRPCTVGVAMPGSEEYISIAKSGGHQVTEITGPVGFIVPDSNIAKCHNICFDAVILANPSYPTSRLLPVPTLLSYLDTCEWVIVDERSIELTLGGESMAFLTGKYRNLIVIRSLCEPFAISGIPISYCIGHPQTIKHVAHFYDRSTLPAFAEVLGEIALSQADSLEYTREFLDTEIPWFQCALSLIPGITVFPAEANYVMCTFNPNAYALSHISTTETLDERLQQKGFLIHNLNGMSGLADNRYFCVSVRTHEDNKKFIAALRASITEY